MAGGFARRFRLSVMRMTWAPQAQSVDAGLDRGVLYFGTMAYPWSGLTDVAEGDSTDIIVEQYLDGVRTVIVQNLGEYSATVSGFTYPDILEKERIFGFSYRVPQAEGYTIHLVYNALFAPTSRAYSTMTSGLDTTDFNWELHATPIHILGSNPVAHLVLKTTDYPSVTKALEDILYGTETSNPRLPSPQEVIDICESVVVLHILYNNDGTWTATGPDEMIQLQGDGTFVLSAPTVFPIDDGRFVVHSF